MVPGWEAQGKGEVAVWSLEEEGESKRWAGRVLEKRRVLFPCGEVEVQREEGICPR